LTTDLYNSTISTNSTDKEAAEREKLEKVADREKVEREAFKAKQEWNAWIANQRNWQEEMKVYILFSYKLVFGHKWQEKMKVFCTILFPPYYFRMNRVTAVEFGIFVH
jgi:hypothetical protein